MKWEKLKDDVHELVNIAWIAAIGGIAYSLGKNLCDRLIR